MRRPGVEDFADSHDSLGLIAAVCGIAGFSGAFTEGMLLAAGHCIAHRGPDGTGHFIGGGVGLVHRRLSIIDLSPRGAQPMYSADGSVVITFNGEIYNYRELREQLRARGTEFRSDSDTEVLIHLYLADGPAMLRRLNGIFAFGLHDRRTDTLFVARDALGIKPLYFAETAEGFAFASEIKALVKLVPGLRELDPPSLHRYMSFLWCPGAGTPLKAVRKLGPGEALEVRGGRIARRWAWYQLPSFGPHTTPTPLPEAIEGTAAHLRTAVERQLVADVPVGAFLSGGLDSSAVVAFARERRPGIRCFTIETIGDQDAGFTDDLPYAKRVARYLDVPLDVVSVESSAMAQGLADMIWQLDEPLADPAPLNVRYISHLAREQGIRVLLSGAGGDDLFSGYRRHLALRYERFWRWLPGPARRSLQHASARLDQRGSMARRLGKLFAGAGLEGDAALLQYFHWMNESDLLALYTREFRNAVAGEPADRPLREFLRGVAAPDPLDRMLAVEQRFFLADHNLTYTDKMAMAAGVEVRVPFLDTDLVDFAARIPASLKQRGATGKWVLKKAMAPYLPHDVIHRPKTGFGAPLRRWMRHDLSPLRDELLSAASLERRGIFDSGAVRRLIERNDSGQVDGAYILFAMLSIEIWCRRFLDAQPAPPEPVPSTAYS